MRTDPTEEIRYHASCLDCDARAHFGDYDSRSRWIGEHRVRTGHDVERWEEEGWPNTTRGRR